MNKQTKTRNRTNKQKIPGSGTKFLSLSSGVTPPAFNPGVDI
jgi:hypothetical protein